VTVADLFAAAVPLPDLDPPAPVPAGTRCALTGAPITEGYRATDLVTIATAEFLDAFRGGTGGWVGVAGARCFRSANPRGGNPLARSWIVFEDRTAWDPLIARLEFRDPKTREKSAHRPAWTDLVRQVWPARAGQRMAMILTTDTKKRLWPRARVMPVTASPRLVADVVGDAEEIAALLAGVTHVGKKRAIGLGEVERWTVAPLPAFALVRDRRLTRPLPADAVALLDGATPAGAPAPIGWTPPQWRPALFLDGWPTGAEVKP
jgi:hypothetical protein